MVNIRFYRMNNKSKMQKSGVWIQLSLFSILYSLRIDIFDILCWLNWSKVLSSTMWISSTNTLQTNHGLVLAPSVSLYSSDCNLTFIKWNSTNTVCDRQRAQHRIIQNRKPGQWGLRSSYSWHYCYVTIRSSSVHLYPKSTVYRNIYFKT